MKKIICALLIGCLLWAPVFSTFAYAEDPAQQIDWQDLELSEEEFHALTENYSITPSDITASDLIVQYSIAIYKDGSTLQIIGFTYCLSSVVKCGFTKVTIQRRASSSDSWSEYTSYTNLYRDFFQYNLTKQLTVPSGYQYRVTCTHYAKKNILSTQKINNTSNTLVF